MSRFYKITRIWCLSLSYAWSKNHCTRGMNAQNKQSTTTWQHDFEPAPTNVRTEKLRLAFSEGWLSQFM